MDIFYRKTRGMSRASKHTTTLWSSGKNEMQTHEQKNYFFRYFKTLMNILNRFPYKKYILLFWQQLKPYAFYNENTCPSPTLLINMGGSYQRPCPEAAVCCCSTDNTAQSPIGIILHDPQPGYAVFRLYLCFGEQRFKITICWPPILCAASPASDSETGTGQREAFRGLLHFLQANYVYWS
jgi:hypothetical protein